MDYFQKLFIALVLGTLMALAGGCNTMEGAGEDMEAAGSAVDEEAEEERSY